MLAATWLLGAFVGAHGSRDTLAGTLSEQVHTEDIWPPSGEDDVLPLLQLTRIPSTPAVDLWNSIPNRTTAAKAVREETLSALAWFESGVHEFNLTGSFWHQQTRHLSELEEKQRSKKLARQAIYAASLILVLMTTSVGIQLVMVEFVMTGACATTRALIGVVVSAVCAVLRQPVVLMGRLGSLLPSCLSLSTCLPCRRSGKQTQASILEVFPDTVLHEVAGHLPLDALCCMSTASRKMQQLSDNHCSYKSLMYEVVRLRLEVKWQRHLRRQRCSEAMEQLQSSESEGDFGADQPVEVEATEEAAGMVEQAALEWAKDASAEAVAIRSVARELRRFLCSQLRKSEEKRGARESEQKWNALMDVSRYAILVVAWFWFSAEVMDLACSPAPTEPWRVLKTIASPCIFLFILESDREHFVWQVLAGLMALVLLSELLYRGFRAD